MMSESAGTEMHVFTDPFGHPDTTFEQLSRRKHLATAAAVGGGIWLLGAIEAAVHASTARGDPYPPFSPPPAPRRSAALPSVVPMVGFDDRGPRLGAGLSFTIR